MSEQVAISVIIPAYNEEQLIGRCLSSLANQDFTKPYEIIVVNNNSTDKTVQVVKKFHVTLISETVQGVVAARQRGLSIARGEIVVGADADCVYPQDWLRRLYIPFTRDEHVAAVGGPARAEPTPYWAYLIYKYGFQLVYWVYRLTGVVFYMGAFNFAFRRQTFLDLGGYKTYLDFGGDEWDPLERLRKVGKIVFDPKLIINVSTRRYRVGFLRWFFVHNLYYYIINYTLARFLKRAVIHAQPVRNI